MKANLANREPEMLQRWERAGLYEQLQATRAGRPTYRAARRAAVRQRRDPHRSRRQQDPQGHGGQVAARWPAFDSPYVPGWDCHGLPIEHPVEKKIGKVGHKIDARAFRAGLPRVRRASRSTCQREDFKRLGVLGDWDAPVPHHGLRATRPTCCARWRAIIANGHLYSGAKPVHWCFDCGSALAEAEIEYSDKTSPAIDVRFRAVDRRRSRRASASTPATRCSVAVPIWTTTPWTLPANQAVALHPELEYVLVEGPARDGRRRQLLVLVRGAGRAGAGALRRATRRRTRPRRRRDAGAPARCSIPFYAREVPRDPRRPRHHRRRHRRRAHRAGPRRRRTSRSGRSTAWRCSIRSAAMASSCPSTELFAGEHVFKAQRAHHRGAARARRAAGQRQARSTVIRTAGATRRRSIFRATPQWFIAMEQARLRQTALDAIRAVRWEPAWGEERIAAHGREPPRLVHLAPAQLGRADRALRAQGRRRAASAHAGTDGAGRAQGRAGRRRCLVRPRPARAARRRGRASTTRSPTCSTCGSIRA